MPLVKYRIYELSARAVISYGRQQDGDRKSTRLNSSHQI